MDPKIWLVVAVILVIGWFAFGVVFNLRRGEAYLRWLQSGLPLVGERTTFRWLGSSVAELVIAKAHKPFRRLETLLVLAPRDVPWLWLFAAAQGRRDTIVFRADLVHPPVLDFELADPKSWTGRLGIQHVLGQGWVQQPYQALLLLAPNGQLAQAESCLAGLADLLPGLGPRILRLSLRRNAPHLEVHLPFPDRSASSEALIRQLQALARAAGGAEEGGASR